MANADTTYCVEYAKSNRSTCKVCKAKIEMGAIRIGTSAPGPGDYMMTSWRHLDCQKKPKALTSTSEISGLFTLSHGDQIKVNAWFEQQMAPKASPKKRKAGAVEGADAAVMGDPKKMKAAELKAALTAAGLPISGKKADHVKALEEVVQRTKLDAKYSAFSVDKLKETLGLNNAIKSGAKQELIDRCVDGALYGALPRCPDCGGGVLKVTYPSKYGHGGEGRYYCPGYHDGDCFLRCSFTTTTVARPTWQDIE